MRPTRRRLVIVAFAVVATATASCTTTVPPLTSVFPTPLIESLPLRIGLIYDQDLRNFTYNETVSDGTNWTIQLGTSNTRLFDRLFDAMFASTTPLNELAEGEAAGVDGIMRPILEEYAFLTPNELGSKFYAVSIRYRLYLYSAQGEELAAWPINAYGQSRAGMVDAGRMKRTPLQAATTLAMRDAAASIIVTLREQPEFRALAGLPLVPDGDRPENDSAMDNDTTSEPVDAVSDPAEEKPDDTA